MKTIYEFQGVYMRYEFYMDPTELTKTCEFP